MVEFRKFKSENISEIGLGTWQLGSSDWGDLNRETAFEILESFYNSGGNFIDTADVYGMGNSEKTIGSYIKESGNIFFIATKLGRRHDSPNGWPQNFEIDAMRRFTEESLNHLGIDQIYLQQLHCIPFDVLKKKAVFDHLRKLQEDKLIKYWGVSVETTEEALFCLEQEGIAAIQIIFNLFRQHVAEELFSKAREKNVALIIRVPLASGLLSGKFDEDTKFSTQDHRNYNANGEAFNVGETFSGIPFDRGLKLIPKIVEIMPQGNLAVLALRWILDHDAVSTVIPGASSPKQVKSNMSASEMANLPEEVHIKLRSLYDNEIKNFIRGPF
ncbi:MAG: aldo/keto reductase [Cyclobacteriaceae bacterium]|nr:aldo/keto reductase [Cyclobacteriaceae bacterium]